MTIAIWTALAVAAADLPKKAPLEQHPGIETAAGVVEGTGGLRLRTITTAPPGAGPLAAVFVVGWLSCDSVELGPNPQGADRLVQDVVRKSKAVVFRVDKPGVGDSEGDCARTDFTAELEGYRRAFALFRRHPRVDPARIVLLGISNGGGFSPLVAGDSPIAAYVSVGGWSKTWFEHMIDLERRRLALSGTEPGRIDAAMKQLAELHAAYLFDRLTPAQVVERRPHLKGVWYDEPDSQYGRPVRFYQQLQDLDLAAAWSKVHVPTLVVWGEYDWIMDRADQEQIVRLVGPSARLLVVPRADHSFSQHADARAAFRNMGRGEYPSAAAEEILAFIRAR
ncbi:MAG TPA: alpha/beta hydrolase [Myxococcales bacterium]|nr:alpha/beta hydrolase [Myxococcales bacterium]